MYCSTPGLPVHHQLPEFTQTHVHRVGDAIQPSHPLLHPVPFSSHLQSFPAPGSFPMSQFFTSSGQHIGVSASNEYSGMISIRTDWLNLLTVQRTLKSLLQHHSSKASILRHSAFFIVQLSHPYTHYHFVFEYPSLPFRPGVLQCPQIVFQGPKVAPRSEFFISADLAWT